MKILVCIKQVGDDGDMNRFDAHALEEALFIKEHSDNTMPEPVSVDIVTAGPSTAEKIIRRAFGMGADRGFHIVTENSDYISSFVTAFGLSAVAKKTSYDLILTGIMSEDMMAGQTGPMMAKILNLPCATGVIKIFLPLTGKTIKVEREMENGFRDGLVILLPAVLTIQAGINTPRYPCLSNMLSANRKQILSLSSEDLFLEPIRARESCIGMEDPEKARTGRVLEGSVADKAAQLFSFLREKNLI
ncbi:MAG: hypothetical protein DRH26_03030 [Deltaproteobacteria bacterium]|nr:MAG: hypothetical protein DRH26_03030 [Deltaproteobacteria bacterium]